MQCSVGKLQFPGIPGTLKFERAGTKGSESRPIVGCDDEPDCEGRRQRPSQRCNFVTLWPVDDGSRRELPVLLSPCAALQETVRETWTPPTTTAGDAAACTILADPYAYELHAGQLQEAAHSRGLQCQHSACRAHLEALCCNRCGHPVSRCLCSLCLFWVFLAFFVRTNAALVQNDGASLRVPGAAHSTPSSDPYSNATRAFTIGRNCVLNVTVHPHHPNLNLKSHCAGVACPALPRRLRPASRCARAT